MLDDAQASNTKFGAYGVEGKIMKNKKYDFLVTALEASCDTSSLPDVVTARIRISDTYKDRQGRLRCYAGS